MSISNRLARNGLTIWPILLLVFGGTATAQNFRIPLQTIVATGGTSSSSNFRVMTVIGQPTSFGSSQSTNFRIQAGFLAEIAVAIAPIANANGPYSGAVGTPVQFDGTNSTDDGAIVSYEWNFGDNSTGTGAKPTHAYASPGTFTVTLNVTDNDGLTGTATTQAVIACAANAYTIAPTSQSFPANGGTGNVNVTAPAGCTWTTVSNANWITITAGSMGNGNGTVSYTVAANISTTPRTGTLTIAGQTFTVTQQGATTDRIVRVTNATASPGSTASLSIELLAQGDENALGFSLTFDPSILSNPQAALGRDASGANPTFNSTQAPAGRYGILISLPLGQRFAAGTKEIIVITFAVNPNAAAVTTPVGFGNQPVSQEVVDVNARALLATWMPGAVTISSGYEADVAPRPNGNNNGTITVADWVQAGRFAAGLDVPQTDVNEFQRADCAPMPCGDGRLGIADWVQAGRYAAGFDPVVAACGPLRSSASLTATRVEGMGAEAGTNARVLRVVNAIFQGGRTNTLSVELDAEGDENALGFSLIFDPNLLIFDKGELGIAATGASLNVNATQKSNGRVGVALALPAGQVFATGTQAILTLSFMAVNVAANITTQINFGDQPIAREIVGVSANSLTASYTAATVTIVPTTRVRESMEEMPAAFELAQNYPNPFNPSTTIAFSLPHAGLATLKVFDLAGNEVATLAHAKLAPGRHLIQWNAGGVESGIYFYRLQAGTLVQTRKLVLLR
jgi:PKD repeat protein